MFLLNRCIFLILAALFVSTLSAQELTVETWAGMASGLRDGTGAAARSYKPAGVAVDSSGNVYIADTYNHTIRKITAAGVVTTLAGSADSPGSTDGTGAAARFYYPRGVAVDSSGNVYVADYGYHTIRKITAAGVVTTLAGMANSWGSSDGPGAAARFNFPSGVAVDSSGNVYVADTNNHTVRKITAAGVVTTLAGTAGSSGSSNGAGAAARFANPYGIAVDSSGSVYVADYGYHTIRKITSAGVVTTLAGSPGSQGSADGTGAAASFYNPHGVAVDSSGNVYVADTDNHTIRKITAAGVVTTLAGSPGSQGSADGTGAAASFYYPYGVAVDSSGNIYVADTDNHTIRKITSAGVVTTLAGSPGSQGSADGTGAAARFYNPWGVAVDSSGNVYVADFYNDTIRKITTGGVVTTLAGTAGSPGSSNGTGAAARFNDPSGVAVDSSGNVYVGDSDNHTIRKITAGGVVTTLAGSTGTSGSADGIGAVARFSYPLGVAVDSSGNVYVADYDNHTIRKITVAGVVTTLVGSASSSGSSDGTGAAARFYSPRGVAVDSSGNVYVADTDNDTIRKCTSAIADSATIDTAVGMTGQARQLSVTGSSATSWTWVQIRHPSGSTATLSSTTIQNPTFTPDIEDVYIWQLTATGPSGKSITYVTLTVTSNGPPIISINASLPYTAGSGAVLLDANATVQDADSTDFDTGNLTISNTNMAEDDLTISSTGTVRLNGTLVEYDASAAFGGSEVVIGTLSSYGLAGADFIITFNASCTPAIAQELLRQIQYEDTLTTPNTTPRSISITLTDDTSLTSASTSVQLVVTVSSGGSGDGGGDDDSGCITQCKSNLWPLLVLLSLLAIPATRRKLARLE